MNGNESIAKMEEAIEKAKDLLNTRVKVMDIIKESPEILAMIGISSDMIEAQVEMQKTMLEEINSINSVKYTYRVDDILDIKYNIKHLTQIGNDKDGGEQSITIEKIEDSRQKHVL